MSVLKKVAAAVLLLSFIVFVALFGRLPALRYISFIDEQTLRLMSIRENHP